MQNEGFSGNEQDLSDKLYNLAIDAARLFRDFSVIYLAEALNVTWEQQGEVEIEAPEFSDVELPFFIAK